MYIFIKFRLKVTGWQAGENRLEGLSANIFAGKNIGWLQFWSVKLPSNNSITIIQIRCQAKQKKCLFAKIRLAKKISIRQGGESIFFAQFSDYTYKLPF